MLGITYIAVNSYVAGRDDAVASHKYGPYANDQEAEKALHGKGWKQRGQRWGIGDYIKGDGDRAWAYVITIACLPRNQLPTS